MSGRNNSATFSVNFCSPRSVQIFRKFFQKFRVKNFGNFPKKIERTDSPNTSKCKVICTYKCTIKCRIICTYKCIYKCTLYLTLYGICSPQWAQPHIFFYTNPYIYLYIIWASPSGAQFVCQLQHQPVHYMGLASVLLRFCFRCAYVHYMGFRSSCTQWTRGSHSRSRLARWQTHMYGGNVRCFRIF